MLALLPTCLALSTSSRPQNFSRRAALGAAGGALAGSALPMPAHAVVEEEDLKVYFGAGCFWHVQHEFVLKEAQELSRSGAGFSAVTGYAGGTGMESGLVCYHNRRSVSDYGRLGHAEAVQVGHTPGPDSNRDPHEPPQTWSRYSAQVAIPPSALPAFADKFIGIFGTRGIRHDPQERARTRARVGLAGDWGDGRGGN